MKPIRGVKNQLKHEQTIVNYHRNKWNMIVNGVSASTWQKHENHVHSVQTNKFSSKSFEEFKTRFQFFFQNGDSCYTAGL